MHSIDHYDTLRRGREELLRQAEQERMARAALLKRKTNWTVRSAPIRLTNAAARLVLRTQVRRKERVRTVKNYQIAVSFCRSYSPASRVSWMGRFRRSRPSSPLHSPRATR